MQTENQTNESIIGKEYPKKVIPLIEAAKNRIDIIVYDWRWYPDQVGAPVQNFNLAMIAAARRGVRVRALLNSRNIVNLLQENGIKARHCANDRTLHTKLMIIDDEIVVIGSHNYTKNAFEINFEASVINKSPVLARTFGDYFDSLFG